MDGAWKAAVEQAKEELEAIFGDLVVEIQEVGSGAVRSENVTVFCKPIIDLAVSVRSIAAAREKLPAMREAGYIHRFKRDNDNRLFFIKRTPTGEHTHHIYILQSGCDLWNDLIHFRDYLSHNTDKLKKYMIIKQDLANKYPLDRNLYNRSRAKFMHNVAVEAHEYFTLDQDVTVKITHKKDADHPYPVGYDADKLAASGKQVTAYLVGADDAEDTFVGRVAATVHSPKGEDRIVVVPRGQIFYEPDIEEALGLQKEDPTITYSCSHEKSCGAVLYTKVDGQRRYLLIKNRSLHAGFPKGHVEYGETEMETVRREILEETGLDVDVVEGFRRDYDYKVRFFIHKTAVYFLAYFGDQTIVPQEGEVLDYWIVPLEEALEHLGFEQDRKILRDADDYLDSLGC
jgi:GrpB-like predicted nucleotidyltransferase (UPF0157 family)/8-oxo-dGTP pyrophosphatase MutT (NUDIX family)